MKKEINLISERRLSMYEDYEREDFYDFYSEMEAYEADTFLRSYTDDPISEDDLDYIGYAEYDE